MIYDVIFPILYVLHCKDVIVAHENNLQDQSQMYSPSCHTIYMTSFLQLN